jgi:hypothetical protein
VKHQRIWDPGTRGDPGAPAAADQALAASLAALVSPSLETQSRNHQVRRHPPNLVKHQRIWDPKRAETPDPGAPAAAGDPRIQGLGGGGCAGGWVGAGRAAQPPRHPPATPLARVTHKRHAIGRGDKSKAHRLNLSGS